MYSSPVLFNANGYRFHADGKVTGHWTTTDGNDGWVLLAHTWCVSGGKVCGESHDWDPVKGTHDATWEHEESVQAAYGRYLAELILSEAD